MQVLEGGEGRDAIECLEGICEGVRDGEVQAFLIAYVYTDEEGEVRTSWRWRSVNNVPHNRALTIMALEYAKRDFLDGE